MIKETFSENKERLVRLDGRIYLWFMLLGLPLIVHDGYFDITEAKTIWFAVGSLAYLVFRLVLSLQFGFSREKISLPEYFAAGFALLTVFSSLMSGFIGESFLGPRGRWQGTAMMIVYALLFYTLRRTRWEEKDLWPPLVSGMLISGALAVAQHLGWDVLGMEKGMLETDVGRYISTLGNINFAGATLTLLLPPVVCLALIHEEKKSRILWGAAAVVGLWAVIAVRSESTILGLGFTLAVLPLLLRKHPAAVRRWPLVLPIFVIALQLYRLAALAAGAYLSALTRILMHPLVSAVLFLLGLGLWILLRRAGDEATGRFLRQYAIALAMLFVLGIGGLILLNTVWKAIPLGPLNDWLRFSPSWGTDRGRIWPYILYIFRNYGFPDKLFGGGCGILPRIDLKHRIFSDAVLDTAHCEYLQILINWGLLGLMAYLGWIGTAFARGVRQGRRPALSAAILAYSIQALVNIAQAPGVCLFFILLPLAAFPEKMEAPAIRAPEPESIVVENRKGKKKKR